MKTYKKVLTVFCNAQGIIAFGCLWAMVILNAIEIVRRYAFGKSWIWIQEISILILVWFTFLAFSKVVNDRNDVAIDILQQKLPKTARRVLVAVLLLLMIAFCVVYIFFSVKLFITQGAMTSNIIHYPFRLRTAVCVLNGGSMFFVYLGELIELLSGKEVKL